MARFKVSLDKENQLFLRMSRLGIREQDLIEKFVKGSGPGGQKKNKTSSCVYLQHKPSGIEVRCEKDRSQALNRFLARRELCDRLEEQLLGIESDKVKAAEKIRRQKRRRSRRQKERMLEGKRHRAQIKSRRGPVTSSDH